MPTQVKARRIVAVEEYEKNGETKKMYANVGILKEITMDSGSHFFRVTLNQNPGVDYKVFDIEPRKDKKGPGVAADRHLGDEPKEDDLPF